MKTGTGSTDRYLLMMGLAASVFAGAGRIRATTTEDSKVVFPNDIEVSSNQSPPVNWAMWGRDRTRIMAMLC